MIRAWTWPRWGWIMAYLYSLTSKPKPRTTDWSNSKLVRFAEWWQAPYLARKERE